MNFDQWIAAHFPKLMGHVQLIPEVLEKDKQQAEFTLPPWDYIDRLATPERMILGQKYLVEFYTELNRISDSYGVSPSLLLAIWGIETNFGKTPGTFPIGSALATLAFAGRARRRPYFNAQLQYYCLEIYPLQGERQPYLRQLGWCVWAYAIYARNIRQIWGSISLSRAREYLGFDPRCIDFGCELFG
jgi:membrane-bound lytic murein transglycosylase B